MATFNEIGSGGVRVGGIGLAPEKVFINGPLRIIAINPAVENISIKDDVYSGWKNWTFLHDNLKFLSAMRSIGGDPLPGEGEFLGSTFFMQNDWKIKITSEVILEGNLFSEDGSNPLVSEGGVVIATSKVSTLVERVTPPASDNARIFI